MNLDTYYTNFFFLLGEAKVVSHASLNSDFKGVTYADFRDALHPLLQQLSDSDLRELYKRLKESRYFNVFIQAHNSVVESETVARGWSNDNLITIALNFPKR